MASEGILLESGTNEVEILEFYLNGQSFGVNVLKVQAIEQYDPEKLTAMPLASQAMPGMFLFRNTTIPLVDLAVDLGLQHASTAKRADDGMETRIVLVMEFNRMVFAFLVDGVDRIHRISWNEISPLSQVLSENSPEFTGSVHIEGREILIVDVEKIVAQLFPDTRMEELADDELAHPKAASRPDVKVLLAEDSTAVRAMISGVLKKGGYTRLSVYENGLAAYEAIEGYKREAADRGCDIGEFLHVLITDIEMPQMDGLTLCRNVRQNLGLAQIPVVVFSSLINAQTAEKCRAVGANDWISKPQIGELVSKLDELCLQEEAKD